MKRQSNASLAFKSKKPADKPTFGANIITKVRAAAATFPNLPVSLEDLLRSNTALLTAVAEAHNGNHTAIAQVRIDVVDWNNKFGETAKYVSGVANGVQTIITEAGFTPTKGESQRNHKPGAIIGFGATINAKKGTVIAGSKRAVPLAKSYVAFAAQDGVTISYDDNTLIVSFGGKSVYISAGTQRQTEFYNLPSATIFNVGMYAVNSAGSGPATALQQVVTQ